MDRNNRQLLDELVTDPELDRLERGLQTFNVFAALGVERLEVQHSNFLAYLLSPQRQHGLRDRFLKRLLQTALKGSALADVTTTAADIDAWELGNAEVLRERRNTDIFIGDGRRFAVVIENKIDSREHDRQLARYRRELAEEFAHRQRLLLYLTPAGALPEEKEERNHWIAVDYASVESVLKEIIDLSKELHLNDEVVFALRHYLEVLRRHIVADSDDAKRCREIYRKHREALEEIRDQVYKQRVRLIVEARQFFEEEIKKEEGLELDEVIASAEIRFVFREIDRNLPRGGTGTKSGRILLLDFCIETNGISFVVTVGPGPKEARRDLFRIAGTEPLKPLINEDGFLKTQWNTIYKRQLLGAEDYSLERDDFQRKLSREWQSVKTDDLPRVAGAIRTALVSSAARVQAAK